MKRYFFFLAASLVCFSCKKEDVKPGQTVDIYLLKTIQTVSGKCLVDGPNSILRDTAIIKNREILSYSSHDYTFELTDTAIQKVRVLMGRTPFAVTVDKQVVYYGFYMPTYLSSSCAQSITMDVDYTSDNKIYLQLGYPGQMQGTSIDDKRNDPLLLATLKQQGKLK